MTYHDMPTEKCFCSAALHEYHVIPSPSTCHYGAVSLWKSALSTFACMLAELCADFKSIADASLRERAQERARSSDVYPTSNHIWCSNLKKKSNLWCWGVSSWRQWQNRSSKYHTPCLNQAYSWDSDIKLGKTITHYPYQLPTICLLFDLADMFMQVAFAIDLLFCCYHTLPDNLQDKHSRRLTPFRVVHVVEFGPVVLA